MFFFFFFSSRRRHTRFSRDWSSDVCSSDLWESDVYRRLRQVKELVIRGTVNILLVHYPAVFDYITELGVGVDLTLAGHTHGGQLSLDWVHRDLNLGLVVTHYTSGWYEKSGAQLYVNRGIGTTGFPIRLGARPEITVFELVRGV